MKTEWNLMRPGVVVGLFVLYVAAAYLSANEDLTLLNSTIAPPPHRTRQADSINASPINREPLGPSSRRTGLVISELMYHPAARIDGKNLEFIELYNSEPTYVHIGGYRISGSIDFTFPRN